MGKVVVSAPGKIILCGEHAVVYGKEAVAFAINLRTRCQIDDLQSENEKNVLTIIVPDLDINKVFQTKDLDVIGTEGESFNVNDGVNVERKQEILSYIDEHYLHGIQEFNQKVTLKIILYLAFICRLVAGSSCGAVVSLSSELPIGGGLGSSASFCVALVTAFFTKYGIIHDQKNWGSKDYNAINNHAYQMECLIHGRPSGIDNSISTYGHALSFKNGQIEQLHQLNDLELSVLVVNTKQSRSTKKLVKDVADRKNKFPDLYDSIFDSIEFVTQAMRKNLLELVKGDGDKNEIYTNIQELVDINQCLLEGIGTGHPSISSIIAICHKYDLHAKLTGAGGGGCIFAIIPPNYPLEKLASVTEELKNDKFECWSTKLGAKGVLLHEMGF